MRAVVSTVAWALTAVAATVVASPSLAQDEPAAVAVRVNRLVGLLDSDRFEER
jgi:hypothetical protein